MRITLSVVLVLASFGCSSADERGQRPDEAVRDSVNVAERTAEDSATGATSADSSDRDAERALLDDACLRGNPSRGEPWFFGGMTDSITLLSLESMQALPPRDSAAFVARIARSVDAIAFARADTSVADFRGLPIVVRDSWRVVRELGDTTYIAIAARRLPIESNPLEEQVTLLASPTSTPSVRDALAVQWSARTAGSEDALEPREPLLAFTTGDARVRVVLLRETPGGPLIELLTRVGGEWITQWEGAVPGCG